MQSHDFIKRTYDLVGKLTKRIFFWVITVSILLLSISTALLMDLNYLGEKTKWNFIDCVRVKTYCEVFCFLGYLCSPMGCLLSFIHYGAIYGNAFIDKKLPSIKHIEFIRKIVINSPDFENKLLQHEKESLLHYNQTGQKRYIKDIKHRIPFENYGIPVFDDWMILLCTDVFDQKMHTSFLVWGMGIVSDKRSPEFFGKQLGEIKRYLFPIKWLNNLEREGLAKGYWILVTESDETSKFSYEARLLNPGERKNIWLNSI